MSRSSRLYALLGQAPRKESIEVEEIQSLFRLKGHFEVAIEDGMVKFLCESSGKGIQTDDWQRCTRTPSDQCFNFAPKLFVCLVISTTDRYALTRLQRVLILCLNLS